MARQKKEAAQLKFYQKLILNRFVLQQFGAADFTALSDMLKNPILEEIDEEGVTGFYKQLVLHFSHMNIPKENLATYDLNIVAHVRTINEKRDTPIQLKYFQYLTLLFVEYYLDSYFNRKDDFLQALNIYINDFALNYPKDAIEPYTENDLNKIALWNATGSGKTLLMHINYYQYLHYAGKIAEETTFILLTPKEDLSKQHLREFVPSSIPAKVFDKNMSRVAMGQKTINVIETTKLGEKNEVKTVATVTFGNKNVLFVDEGHRGASGDVWYKYRNQLCEEGFSFEYSATFGQAVAKDKKLLQEYAKCILFDYSYKYFYSDGYGKDYHIMNLESDEDTSSRSIYLTGALLAYYQQKKYHLKNKAEVSKFNVENPLFVFVGSKVNAVRTANGKEVSDVVDILLFFNDFIAKPSLYIDYIQRILQGNAILDKQDRDVFRYMFTYLESLSTHASSLYQDIKNTVFNCQTSTATLHIENLSVEGEIQLRLGENAPFGLINVGDSNKLLALCEKNGLHTAKINFNQSLFHSIDKADSTINVLIGSKKFSEGWNSWRVATMGFMNVGRSEGSEIIQLFGRGVRLKGYNISLKRSPFVVKDIPTLTLPAHLHILETLNIFGIRADYMKAFKEMLEEEGVPTDKGMPITISMPVIKNKYYQKSNILTLRLKNNLDYKKHAPKPFLEYKEGIKVDLDCYAKVQFETSSTHLATSVNKKSCALTPEHLALLDFESIYFALQRYKREKARHNVNIDMQKIQELAYNHRWYTLYIPEEELEIKTISDLLRIEKIVLALLLKYIEKFYYTTKNTWEKPLLELVPMQDSDVNFLKGDEYTITVGNEHDKAWVAAFVMEIKEEIEIAQKEKRIPDFVKQKYCLEATAFANLMYTPFLYVANGQKEISVAPVALNESENTFIQNLRKYVAQNSEYFADKELYIIRNKSKQGIAFFEGNGFYPDFIMWIIYKDKQYMNFIDPHGMRNTAFTDAKVELYAKIKDIQAELEDKVILNSFILSPTKYVDLPDKSHSEHNWNEKNVFFMENAEYIKDILSRVL